MDIAISNMSNSKLNPTQKILDISQLHTTKAESKRKGMIELFLLFCYLIAAAFFRTIKITRQYIL